MTMGVDVEERASINVRSAIFVSQDEQVGEVMPLALRRVTARKLLEQALHALG